MVFLLVLEKHIHLFIRLIRTSLREPLSLDLPAYSIGAVEHVWESTKRVCGNDCIFVCFFFVVLRFPPWGVSCVSFYSHYRQSKLCSTKKLHIFILFTSFFLRLKFSKTPFHVVLSKNKTNTKKKYHFSLLISVSFHSSQFFFSALNLYTSEPLSRQKLTALVCVFVIFWVAFTFFSFFFSRFFFFILLLKYTFLHAHGFYTTILLHELLSFPPRVCVCR